MSPETAIAYIWKTADDLKVGDIASEVAGDPKFYLWSGSSRKEQHHYGKHGLLAHTAEVIQLCLANNALLGDSLDKKELFLAALFHDCGKMWDYAPVQNNGVPDYDWWYSTDHKRRIHHISRSAIQWSLAAEKWELSQTLIETDEVTHAILAHHGQRAWGSPVAPKSGLAWMLHLCDGISARMNDYNTWDQYSGAK